MEINEETTLAEVLKTPNAEGVLREAGVPCLTCPMMQAEMGFLKLSEVCASYEIDFEELKRKLTDL